MTVLFTLLALALVFLALCAWGRPYWAWVVPGAIALLWWRVSAGPSGAFTFFAVAFGLAALVFGLPPVRALLLGRPVLKIVGGMLPKMSATEKEALEAGTVWWDGQLFTGAPDWQSLLDYPEARLSPREKDFLDGPVTELCRMLDDHQITKDGDLPPEVWDFIKREGFMGMIIPEEYGGLGLSAAAQSAVIARLTARSGTASVTVMVPNSLGPAELLLHYGTEAEKAHWLPRLARGEEVPCFALTEPPAGSDAASMQSSGVVCKRQQDGEEVLGILLNWNKRYITLSPVATVLGLAFKLRDPDKLLGGEEELGITCALVPADAPGVTIGERHDPLGVPFMNGPTFGHDVFVPIDSIIGGRANAGKGWRMLMQSLSAGRGISLPSLSSGAAQLATRVTGAYSTVREQFNMPIGRFEGIEARLGRIAGLTYVLNAARRTTVASIDQGEKPSVVTAVMKAYSTEAMRVVINDAMDVQGGAGICRGPRNVLAHAYQAVPIGITVEGANILTRSMIIFGQGAIRCHPWVQAELTAAAERDVSGFDRAFFGHVGFVFTNVGRSIVHGLTGARLAPAPVMGAAAPYFQAMTRASASFALLGDAAMGTLGAALKRKENLSGRLADCLAWLYLGSATLKQFVGDGQPERDLDAFRWAMDHALFEIQEAMLGLLDNLPNRPTAIALRLAVFPLGAHRKAPSDRLTSRVARSILEGGEAREALTGDLYIPAADEPGLGQLEAALGTVLAARGAARKLKDAQRARKIAKGSGPAIWDEAARAGVLTPEDVEHLRAAAEARDAAIQVDAFPSGDPSVYAQAM